MATLILLLTVVVLTVRFCTDLLLSVLRSLLVTKIPILGSRVPAAPSYSHPSSPSHLSPVVAAASSTGMVFGQQMAIDSRWPTRFVPTADPADQLRKLSRSIHPNCTSFQDNMKVANGRGLDWLQRGIEVNMTWHTVRANMLQSLRCLTHGEAGGAHPQISAC